VRAPPDGSVLGGQPRAEPAPACRASPVTQRPCSTFGLDPGLLLVPAPAPLGHPRRRRPPPSRLGAHDIVGMVAVPGPPAGRPRVARAGRVVVAPGPPGQPVRRAWSGGPASWDPRPDRLRPGLNPALGPRPPHVPASGPAARPACLVFPRSSGLTGGGAARCQRLLFTPPGPWGVGARSALPGRPPCLCYGRDGSGGPGRGVRGSAVTPGPIGLPCRAIR